MMRGRFISFEGGEGAGKSTQARLLAAALADRGIDAALTREPGGSEGAEAIRSLLLGGTRERWDDRTEALLFAAARADHVRRTIRPALAAGRWVVCDRFVDSSRAYQGGAGLIGDADILSLHAFGSHGLLPDRTLVLTAPVAEASRRLALRDGGDSDRIAARGDEYHADVAATFLMLAEAEPDRVRIVDAGGSVGAVAARVLSAVDDLF